MKIETFFCDVCEKEFVQGELHFEVLSSSKTLEHVCSKCGEIIHQLENEIHTKFKETAEYDFSNVNFMSVILRYTDDVKAEQVWGEMGLKNIKKFKADYPIQTTK